MAKFTLEIEQEYDFDLIGVCSHHADYKVCWAINERIGSHFFKEEEAFKVYGKKHALLSTHSQYKWYDEEEKVNLFLLKNKDNKTGKYLIPEKQGIDYFILVQEEGVIDVERFVDQLKTINCILTALTFAPEELKSADRLLMD